ncbi:MAG TPA: hydroxymethylbilane synthase [Abditibacteriaceae bacterium]|jgi:hydroxymethylbilane synthase
MKLIMGTRGSALALAQARQFARHLEAAHPGLKVEEQIIRTTGDKQQSAPLPAIGGKGVFTLEIEAALHEGVIDFAVHSLKDLPPELPEGLILGAIPHRANASDVFILRNEIEGLHSLDALPFGARIGTSSLRRQAQLLSLRPDLQIEDIRGNIDTRLRKLDEQNFDAIILAHAGLERLGLREAISGRCFDLDQNLFVPAPGQGALAIEARNADKQTLQLLSKLDDALTRAEISAERTAMRALNAGCSTPLGARAVASENALHLWAVVLSPDGKQRVFAEARGLIDEAVVLGEGVARQLLDDGAADLMINSMANS